MLKRYSALDSNYLPGKYSYNNNVNISFKEYSNLNLQQIACWPNNLFEVENFFKKESFLLPEYFQKYRNYLKKSTFNSLLKGVIKPNF